MGANMREPACVVINAQAVLDVLKRGKALTRCSDPFDCGRQKRKIFVHLLTNGAQHLFGWDGFIQLCQQIFLLRHKRGQRLKICRDQRLAFLVQYLM